MPSIISQRAKNWRGVDFYCIGKYQVKVDPLKVVKIPCISGRMFDELQEMIERLVGIVSKNIFT